MTFTKDTLKELLANNTLEVKFTKKDGSTRIMKCTTDESLIPAEFAPVGAAGYEDNHPTQVRAFDLEAEGWRSFTSTNVIEVAIL